ncbi:hypothetical protein [Paraburkholderia sp. UYCP14C]|uniref:hypothetical protein n=1 Tax=Paraburkholderia sp. UYCP14C TaxID=2511130 RepID=UPI0020071CC4|nr:hypothetical protein [Paraburkholderia sp. UYCP14C]
MYVLAYLDRANVGFAQQALHDVVGISDAAFAFGASIFFVAYVLLEVPSNLALHKVDARLWMCRIMGPHSLGASLANRTVLYFGLVFFLIQMGVSVVVFYLPTFIGKLLGTGPNTLVGLVVAIPWACALVATYAVPKAAGRTGRLTLFGGASLAVAAFAMFASAGASPVISVVALCIAVAGLWAVQPIFWTMLTNCVGGIAAVSGVAMVNTIGNVGNFVSPNIKAWADASFGSNVAGLIVLSVVVLLAALLFIGARSTTRSVIPTLLT